MAKTISTEKEKYGFLTREQAALVWASAKPTVGDLVKTGPKPREKFNSTSILSAPQMWPSLADALLMKGVGDGKELDFEKLAEHFNKIIKAVNAEKTLEPKPLTGADVRKLALDLTRKRLADANDVLAKTLNDVGALAKQKEAKSILAKNGWAEVAKKRETNTKGNAGKVPKTTPEAKPVEPVKPVEKSNNLPKEVVPVTKPVTTDPERFYITGDTKPVKEELKKIGGQYEPKITSWWFTSEAAQAKGQKIVDDFNGGTK